MKQGRLAPLIQLSCLLGLLFACEQGGVSIAEIPPAVNSSDTPAGDTPVATAPSSCSGGLSTVAEGTDDTATFAVTAYAAQSFVLSSAHTVDSFQLHLDVSATGATVSLNADNAGAPNLASPLATQAIAASGDAWYNFPVSGVTLSAGVTYYIVITVPGPGVVQLKNSPHESAYSGGASYRSTNGTTWNNAPIPGDLAFRVKATCS